MLLIPLDTLSILVLVGFGMSFVVTGSTIGKPLRIMAWLTLRHTRLDSLARCPYCCAWWCAFALAAVSGLPWWQWLEAAFATCGVAAIVQAQWRLAASEDFDSATQEKSSAPSVPLP